MNKGHWIRMLMLMLSSCALLLALGACDRPEQASSEHAHDDTAEHAEGKTPDACCPPDAGIVAVSHEDEAEDDAHAGHDHGGEGSDLDRPVAELFAASCEHDIQAHLCEECSYEVGIVRVSPAIIEQGLVSTQLVDRSELPDEIELTGEIQFDASRIAHLGPRTAGVIDRVLVDLGVAVEAGQVLMEIESAELADTEAEFLGARAERDLAERTHDRLRELREANISSEREFLEAVQKLESATILANSTRQRLLRLGLKEDEVARLEKRGIQEATGRLAIRAPFAGEILQLHAVRGERIDPDSELALLGDTNSLWLWADLYESQLASVSGALAAGLVPARIFVNAFPEHQFTGHLDFLGRVMDEHTRTVKARVILQNLEGLLRPGMFARVRLGIGAPSSCLVVPRSAVLNDEGRDFVFVRHDDEFFIRRPVSIGRAWDGFLEINAGLDIGQVVASTGAFLLKSDVLRSKMGAGCAD